MNGRAEFAKTKGFSQNHDGGESSQLGCWRLWLSSESGVDDRHRMDDGGKFADGVGHEQINGTCRVSENLEGGFQTDVLNYMPVPCQHGFNQDVHLGSLDDEDQPGPRLGAECRGRFRSVGGNWLGRVVGIGNVVMPPDRHPGAESTSPHNPATEHQMLRYTASGRHRPVDVDQNRFTRAQSQRGAEGKSYAAHVDGHARACNFRLALGTDCKPEGELYRVACVRAALWA